MYLLNWCCVFCVINFHFVNNLESCNAQARETFFSHSPAFVVGLLVSPKLSTQYYYLNYRLFINHDDLWSLFYGFLNVYFCWPEEFLDYLLSRYIAMICHLLECTEPVNFPWFCSLFYILQSFLILSLIPQREILVFRIGTVELIVRTTWPLLILF